MAATRDRTEDLVSRPVAQYGLTCASSSDKKSFVFVKLTEQALLAIEQYVQQQVSTVLVTGPDPHPPSSRPLPGPTGHLTVVTTTAAAVKRPDPKAQHSVPEERESRRKYGLWGMRGKDTGLELRSGERMRRMREKADSDPNQVY